MIAANRLTSRVTVLRRCLSPLGGPVRFHDNGTVASGVNRDWAKAWGGPVNSYDVEAVTLDALLAGVAADNPGEGTIVCKVDIEGHEEAVFEAARCLNNPRFHFVVEIHNCANIEKSRVYACARDAGRELTVLGRCWEPHLTVWF
jgi:hypothetical protein